MTHRCIILLLTAACAVCAAAAAPASSILSTNAAAPARRSQTSRLLSPEIQSDRRVTFRLRAPKAKEVVLNGRWANGRAVLAPDTNGVWSVMVGPIEPGIYEYNYNVDDLAVIDPGNPAVKPMREPRSSILHLPSDPPSLQDYQDVPHGVVRQHTYRSKSLGRLRELAVYTSPGYDQQPDARFPTLYLQHGSGDNQATWIVLGKAHWILDNLIAQGRARPMVVVMMDGHALAPGSDASDYNSNTTAFERDLLQDVMPFIEANYRVKPEAANRGVVGLSMGGEQSLTIGLNHLEHFAWVGGFSSAVPAREAVAAALERPESTKAKLKLLWIGCGKDDFLLKENEEFIALLKEQKLHHEWHLTDGDHNWQLWRIYLGDFLPMLF